MKLFFSLILSFVMVVSINASAQPKLPCKVDNVELEDLKGNKTKLPFWGEKNLLLFYVDPDHPKQNEDFTLEMEQNHKASGPNIVGYGIMNLADAPFVPNSMACKLAYKRTAENKAIVLADKGNILSKKWNLESCNNKFTILIVTKEGELVYMKKGELTKDEQEEFYKIVAKYL